MKCKLLLKLWKTEDKYEIDFCPTCGVHAPWVNDCKVEEE